MSTDYSKIAEENLRKYGTEIERIGKMLLSHRYSDRTHFVFELLQNAEDAIGWRNQRDTFSRAVTFVLETAFLEFSHFGLPFEERHVRAICGIGESTKDSELTAIGRFGIGFKSVYAFTQRPEIHSGDEHFVVEAFVRPQVIKGRELVRDQTLFHIPFNDSQAPQEVLSRLRVLGHRTLLFLRHIESIEWRAWNGEGGIFLREAKEIDDKTRLVTLLGQSLNSLNDTVEQWLVFSKDIFTEQGSNAGQVEIAFSLVAGKSGNLSVVPVSESSLVVYFPTEKETNLGFLVQGPYRTTPSRDNIPRDDKWNQHLIAETSILVKESLIRLRELGYMTVGALSTMPLDSSKFKPTYGHSGPDHMFRPIFENVKSSLLDENLIPTSTGTHVSGRQAKISRTERLRMLMGSDQLSELFKSKAPLHWVSEEITKDKSPHLRSYLMSELDVDEIDSDTLIPLVTKEFFEKQSDDWIADFYALLVDQPSLWRSSGFRAKPIIRLQNGKHIIPFDEKNRPQVFLPSAIGSGFPTVRGNVCDKPEAAKFLKALGLTEPDPVDDVIVNVLPQFGSPTEKEKEPTYGSLISRIVTAFQTDSASQRKKLQERLEDTPFVECFNARTNERRLCRPSEAYFGTENMRVVFANSSEVWFVADTIPALKGEASRRLLEACGVRTYFRRFECKSSLTWQEKEDLRRTEGALKESWDKSTDYDVAGLKDAARAIGSMPIEQAVTSSQSLWSVLLDTLREARDTFFNGTYRWGYFQSSWLASFPAKFTKDLMTTQWVPTQTNECRSPQEICFSEVHECIRELPNPILEEILGFRPEAILRLAEESGIELASIELLKKHGLTSDKLLDLLKNAGIVKHESKDVDEALKALMREDHPEPNPPPVDSGAGEFSSGTGSPAGGASGERPDSGGPGGGSGTSASGSQSRQARFQSYIYVSPGGDADPDGLNPQETARKEKIAREGVDYVIEQEQALGYEVTEMPHTNEGYDLELRDKLGNVERYVEVKSTGADWGVRGVTLSHPQFEEASRRKEKFWLYVVENAGLTDCKLFRIQNPVAKIRSYVFDDGWKYVSEDEGSKRV